MYEDENNLPNIIGILSKTKPKEVSLESQQPIGEKQQNKSWGVWVVT